ncbi:S24/S26 family peptidase [Bifidobacterium pullorum subsp. saeculare]|uniref:S24/S26 family peptidase n=1 Tax=Bifidobacterium pullorum subsp. saeculare TaxID=78257 RepID=A0A938WXZ7_9BIFI|nr:S24/S26 family peptidase [Bifidobacterium pullorum]MBM6699688.1 S24/S26 family peptidase [Bifidobacterium pullorum subsp. saeculare]
MADKRPAGSDASPEGRIEWILRREGMLVAPAVGASMRPMLRDRRDTVTIRALGAGGTGPDVGDVILYRAGGRYVLHRIVGRWPDGTWRVRGDNTLVDESVPVERVLGTLVEWNRGPRRIVCRQSAWYRRYWRFWLAFWPLRRVLMRTWRTARHAGGTLLRWKHG